MFGEIEFPPVEIALDEPNGLLATGGNLRPETILNAYSKGIFPWFSGDQPIMWWSPNPRAVIYPNLFQPSKSLKKTLRRCGWTVTINQNFEQVINACATQPRPDSEGHDSWITTSMIASYCELHRRGHAHSVEVWNNNELVGGLYGVACGVVFSGESMFHLATDASKVAFSALCQHTREHNIQLIDCQISNPHLTSLGAVDIPRSKFVNYLPGTADAIEPRPEIWQQLTHTNAAEYAKVFDEHNQ